MADFLITTICVFVYENIDNIDLSVIALWISTFMPLSSRGNGVVTHNVMMTEVHAISSRIQVN